LGTELKCSGGVQVPREQLNPVFDPPQPTSPVPLTQTLSPALEAPQAVTNPSVTPHREPRAPCGANTLLLLHQHQRSSPESRSQGSARLLRHCFALSQTPQGASESKRGK